MSNGKVWVLTIRSEERQELEQAGFKPNKGGETEYSKIYESVSDLGEELAGFIGEVVNEDALVYVARYGDKVLVSDPGAAEYVVSNKDRDYLSGDLEPELAELMDALTEQRNRRLEEKRLEEEARERRDLEEELAALRSRMDQMCDTIVDEVGTMPRIPDRFSMVMFALDSRDRPIEVPCAPGRAALSKEEMEDCILSWAKRIKRDRKRGKKSEKPRGKKSTYDFTYG